jgi:hydroxymethylbilane synthase
VLRVATRGSALARWQATEVSRLLGMAHPGREVEVLVVETTGDRQADVPVWEMGGQGVFVKEVQAALLDGRADLAVHSAKDLPSITPSGLALAAVPGRGDPRDCLVGGGLEDLAPGAQIATGSVRRRAQLAWWRPDLTFTGLRGNITTRLDRIPAGGAIVMAVAALQRLGLAERVSEVLEPAVMVPQVGQGALAVECRADDQRTLEFLAAIDVADSRAAVAAERSFLAQLGSGCDLPVGAYARTGPAGGLLIDGVLASPDGRLLLRDSRRGPQAEGERLGRELADHLANQAGGTELVQL